jgi:TolA-binding protein
MAKTKEEQRALQQDQFLDSMSESVGYLQRNRDKVIKVGAFLLGILTVVGAAAFYMDSQKKSRQTSLQAAFAANDAPVSETAQAFTKTFKTQAEKDAEVDKAFRNVVAKHDGSEEAAIAHYYLGVRAADAGKLAEAKSELNKAVDKGSSDTTSLARLALTDVLVADNNVAEAEKVLQSLVDKPTSLVSKEQATIALARLVARRDVAKAKSMLEPLRSASGAVGRAAVMVIGEISASNPTK